MVFLSVLSGASFNTGIDQGLIYSWDFLFRRFQEHILQLRRTKLATQLICLKFALNVFFCKMSVFFVKCMFLCNYNKK